MKLFDGYTLNLLLSVIVGILAWSFKAVATKAIQKWNLRSLDQRRRWMYQARLVSLSILVFGLVIIWASEIRTLALSLAALAVAIVIGLKELATCLLGAFLKASNQSFRIGDRISIGGHRGDVIESNLLATTLLEVGSAQELTGRTIVIPNAIFLAAPVMNESLGQFHCLHQFEMLLPYEIGSPTLLLQELERLAWMESRQYLKPTQRLMDRFAKTKTIDSHGVEAKVWLEFKDPKAFRLCVRVPCRVDQRGSVEQKIKRQFFESPNLKISNVQS